ncbi:MAG: zinc ABC transporter substrate-binding protein [Clostridia bacterium]|nr:zinc ABC transporter substrate-binding protein [Clostridia bacterium]
MLKRISLFILIFLFAFSACAELEIVCSLFPQYDFTRRIAGDRAHVTKLLPDGIDSHGYEPSARDMVKTDMADLFIYTDDLLEGWVKNLSGGLTNVKMIHCAEGIDLEKLNEEWESASDHDHDHGHEHSYDAHIWLDPTLSMKMCENILNALIAADPAGEEIYKANYEKLIQELAELDNAFFTLFEENKDKTLYFGGKFAYSHFLRRYHVPFVTAYANCSDEGEPGMRRIITIISEMNESGAKTIFTDEMSSGQIAQAIASETNAEILLFHTAHNLSKDDMAKNLSYLDIMYMNLENIKLALSVNAEAE